MYLKLERGFFKYDVIDHYAFLGVEVDANVQEIRKRYLQIARRLHPDRNSFTLDAEKNLANQLLSKYVNPAYEALSMESSRVESLMLLSHLAKSLVQESASVQLTGDLAKQLVSAANIDYFYKTAIAKLNLTQYESLEQVSKIICHISELNLVYLMQKTTKTSTSASSPHPPQTNLGTSQLVQASASATPAKPDSPVDQYVRRAQEFIDNNQLTQAKVELQDALRLEPKNSQCHSLIALVYLKQNQVKMAKIHFDNALKLNPKDEIALTWKPKIEKALGQQSSGSKVASPPENGNKQPDQSGGGGLFGGLFGGNKK
jgi:curved DNA-binding protein CbpA